MMTPVSKFTVKDSYKYLEGFGTYHQSEAIPGANPEVINSPQKPPFGLRTERISGSSFTAPRDKNYQTWLYRIQTSLAHDEFLPYEKAAASIANPPDPQHLTPNSYLWPSFPVDEYADWISQKLLARNGDPQRKSGLALWIFSVTKDMPEHTAFSSLDGETLIVPQAGALDIQTEMGKLVVRQNEIAVIPRSARYRVTLPDGRPCRGYICELFEGHFQLPELGIVGSTGLANVRDFQIPAACFDGDLADDGKGSRVARARKDGTWTIVSRLAGRLWSCTQGQSPFDVVAWHGTCYPYKYDLARFCVLSNGLFDEHDPCLYTVLTARSHRSAPGTAVVDFAIIPPRWQVAEDTYWLPYYHRNTMQEFYGPIVNAQAAEHPFNEGQEFLPFAAGLNGAMATHGATEGEYRRAREIDTKTPTKMQTEGITLFLFETERPLYLSEWAYRAGVKNFNGKAKEESKL
ncbi:homogentisate 1,2-dioxygenase [Xylariaceae sp. FL0016]|nr:homogentisate 1,2-dioxygenase [Xylariaceae sp. FL0016]